MSLKTPSILPAGYAWAGSRADLIAGLTVAAVAVPQAMAYALIAGVDPRYGLYTAIVMTALGSIFGSSAHLINGPTNAISLVVLSAIAGLGADGLRRRTCRRCSCWPSSSAPSRCSSSRSSSAT